MDDPRVKHILFYVALKPGNLMLAEMQDGTYCVLRDDKLVPRCCWRSADVATTRFNEMRSDIDNVENCTAR